MRYFRHKYAIFDPPWKNSLNLPLENWICQSHNTQTHTLASFYQLIYPREEYMSTHVQYDPFQICVYIYIYIYTSREGETGEMGGGGGREGGGGKKDKRSS